MSGLRMPGPVARRDFFLCFGSQLIRPCSPLGRPHLPRGLNHMFYNTTILYVFPYFYTSTFSSQQWACFTDELTLDFVGARLERAAAISRHQGRHPSFDVLWEKESLKRTLCLIWYVIMHDVSCTDYMPFLVPCFIYIRVYIRYIYIYIYYTYFPGLFCTILASHEHWTCDIICGYYMQGQNLRQFLRIHFELQKHRNQQQRGRTILRLPPIMNSWRRFCYYALERCVVCSALWLKAETRQIMSRKGCFFALANASFFHVSWRTSIRYDMSCSEKGVDLLI